MQNNPGNIEATQKYAGQTGEKYGTGKNKDRFAVYDSPLMGLRALFMETNKKLKDFDGDVEKALLKYLGGGSEGTLEERYKIASKENPNIINYINTGKAAYEKDGVEGLVRQIIVNENKPVDQGGTRELYLNDSETIKNAQKLSHMDMPSNVSGETAQKLTIMDLPLGTKYKDAMKVYQQGEYPRKKGGRVERNPYNYEPKPI